MNGEGGEWVRLPNGNWRWFSDQELAAMRAAAWEENKQFAYIVASITAIISISFGSFLLYATVTTTADEPEVQLTGYIIFGTLGILFCGAGIWLLKSFYPAILPTFFVTLIVVAFSLWGVYSCIFGGSEKEKQKQEQKETKEKSGEYDYEPIPAEFYQY